MSIVCAIERQLKESSLTIDPSHIRSLFLQPKPRYTPAEAAEAVGWPVEEVLGWMEVGELEGTDTPHGEVLAWGELASFAMGFCEPEEIEAALGAEVVRELLDLVSAHSHWLMEEIPGLAAALAWPS